MLHDNNTDVQIEDSHRNHVMGGRRASRCTQKDVWSFNKAQFNNIYELTEEANIKFPDRWVTQLHIDFSGPRIIGIINSAGSSSLVSSTTFTGGAFVLLITGALPITMAFTLLHRIS